MKTVLKGLLLSCVLVVVTGCGVTGKWTMKSISPESEAKQFNMKCLCLMNDGTYMACATEGDQAKCLKGTYDYDAKTKTLAFKTDGKERSYHAEVSFCGCQMKVTPTEKGQEWTAIMKHAGACSKEKCCCMKACDMKACPAAKVAPCKAPPEKAEKAETKKPAEAKKPVEGKKPAEAKPGDTK